MKGVGHDVSLAPLDLLAGIIARNPAAFGGLDALAVDHTRRRARLAALEFARAHRQQMIERLPQTVVAPPVVVSRRWWELEGGVISG